VDIKQNKYLLDELGAICIPEFSPSNANWEWTTIIYII